MATLDFPTGQADGYIHTHEGKQWQYVSADSKWVAYGVSLAPDVLKVDTANNRVGINQTSPAYGLDVTGTARVTGVITASGGVVGDVTGDVTGDVSGNAGGTAATVTGAAQTAITSVGTLTGLTVSGAIDAADQIVQKPVLKDVGETCVANATSGSADTIDLQDGNVHNVTLTADCTFTFSNPPASGTSGSFTLFLNQDATGSRTVTWPGSVKWAGGTAPTLTTTASRTDILVFTTIDGGTIWYGAVSGQDFS